MIHGVTFEEIGVLLHDAIEENNGRVGELCIKALDGDMVAWVECARIVKSRRETVSRISIAVALH